MPETKASLYADMEHGECKRTMNDGCLACFGTGVVTPKPCRACGGLTRETAFNVPDRRSYPYHRRCPIAR